MTAADRFKELLGLVHAELKPLGFKKRGQNFYLGGGNNVGLVNFQKSQFGSRHDTKFTVNVGAWSRRLEDAFPMFRRTGELPAESACHCRERIGKWIPSSGGDKWWYIDADTDVGSLAKEILPTLSEHAVPFIRRRLSDEQLRDRLFEGDFGFVTSRSRDLLFLAELLSEIGPFEALPRVLEDLETEAAAAARPEFMARLQHEIGRIAGKRANA